MLTKEEIWFEMARRYVQFHLGEQWDKIKLWGLFKWGDIISYLKKGELKTTMKKENVVVWVQPSEEAWKTKIKPLIEKYNLEELTIRAGWV